MKINRLTLLNFQGIKSAEFQLEGRNATIYGDNATGKTTVFNAITWLLFGTASTGAKNYTPKTKGADGDLHNLEHSAEAEFEIDDGRVVTIRKCFHENYKKKRGSAIEEFDGHSIDFYIDGVPTKEKEFKAAITNLIGSEELLKMLTMPDYFSETMSWDNRRKILLEVCGDVSDADVLGSSEELSELSELLIKPGSKTGQRYTVDEYKKILTARKADINKNLASLPARIDEVNLTMRDTPPEDELRAEEAELAARQNEAEPDMTGDIRRKLAELRTKRAEKLEEAANAKTRYATEAYNASAAEHRKIADLLSALSAKKAELTEAKGRLCCEQAEIRHMTDTREKLLAEYNTVRATAWDKHSENCPTCGRPLPEEDVEKRLAEFNANRSAKLQKINLRGQKEASQQMIAEHTAEADKLEKHIAELEAQIDTDSAEISRIRAGIVETPFEKTEEYSRLAAEEAEITNAIREAEYELLNGSNSQQDTKADISERLAAVRRQLEQIKLNAALQERVKELEAEEKRLGAEYEAAEQGVYLCEQFVKAKVRRLTDAINSRFRNVRFRLFVEQLNGGIKDDCEVMIPGEGGRMVPYTFANNAARINAGLEIIDVLSEYYGKSLPVVIDNAESVTHLIPICAQTIRLCVSEAHKKLTLALN